MKLGTTRGWLKFSDILPSRLILDCTLTGRSSSGSSSSFFFSYFLVIDYCSLVVFSTLFYHPSNKLCTCFFGMNFYPGALNGITLGYFLMSSSNYSTIVFYLNTCSSSFATSSSSCLLESTSEAADAPGDWGFDLLSVSVLVWLASSW